MPPSLPDGATDEDVESLLWEQMKTVYDPEIPVNIVDLGLIYRCEMNTNEKGERVVDVDAILDGALYADALATVNQPAAVRRRRALAEVD